MKNKLSLLLLISAFSLGLKANDSIRKRTVDFSLISNTYFLNNNSTNGNILSSPTTVLDFEAKLMFGKRKWKHVVFFSRDTYRYKLTYGIRYVAGTVYYGGRPHPIYGNLVDVDRVITSNYFSIGYGLSKRCNISKRFSLLSNVEFCLLVHSIDNIKNNYMNSTITIPEEVLRLDVTYKSNTNFGRIALGYKLNSEYKLTNKISFLAGINLTSSLGRRFYGDGYSGDDKFFFTDNYLKSKGIYITDSPSSTYQPLRLFASINIGVNFKIR